MKVHQLHHGSPLHSTGLVRTAIIFLKKVFKPFQLEPAWYEELLINKFLEKKSNFQLTSWSDSTDKSSFKKGKIFTEFLSVLFSLSSDLVSVNGRPVNGTSETPLVGSQTL